MHIQSWDEMPRPKNALNKKTLERAKQILAKQGDINVSDGNNEKYHKYVPDDAPNNSDAANANNDTNQSTSHNEHNATAGKVENEPEVVWESAKFADEPTSEQPKEEQKYFKYDDDKIFNDEGQPLEDDPDQIYVDKDLISSVFSMESKLLKKYFDEELDQAVIKQLGKSGEKPINRLIGKYMKNNADIIIFGVVIAMAHAPVLMKIGDKMLQKRKAKKEQQQYQAKQPSQPDQTSRNVIIPEVIKL